jgi:hypothetical protein
MSEDNRPVRVLSNAGDAWPLAEDLAAIPGGDQVLVELDGRRIEGARLIECYRWLFGQ